MESQRPVAVRSRILTVREEAQGKSKQDLIKELDEAIESLKEELSERERRAYSLGVSPEKIELLGGKGRPERAPAESSIAPGPIHDDISIRVRELEVLDWEACNLFLENRIKEKNREREKLTSRGGHQQPAQQQPQAQSSTSATLVRQRDPSSSGSSVDGRPRAKEPRQSQAQSSIGPRQARPSTTATHDRPPKERDPSSGVEGRPRAQGAHPGRTESPARSELSLPVRSGSSGGSSVEGTRPVKKDKDKGKGKGKARTE